MATSKIYKRIPKGTDIEINVNMQPIGANTMSSVDWECVFFVGDSSYTVTKKESQRVDDDNYLCPVETATLDRGVLQCRMIAEIPNNLFRDGSRTEIAEFEVDNIFIW